MLQADSTNTNTQGTEAGAGAGVDIGARLLAIGKTSSRRAARRIVDLRGVPPSDTSRDDAASDAVTGVLVHVRRLDKLTAAQWDTARVRRVLALYAGRAAFLSLAQWAGAGLTGDNTASARFDSAFSVELTHDLAQRLASESVTQGNYTDADARARRAVVRWVFQVGLRDFGAGLDCGNAGARARSLREARRRCRAVGSMVVWCDDAKPQRSLQACEHQIICAVMQRRELFRVIARRQGARNP